MDPVVEDRASADAAGLDLGNPTTMLRIAFSKREEIMARANLMRGDIERLRALEPVPDFIEAIVASVPALTDREALRAWQHTHESCVLRELVAADADGRVASRLVGWVQALRAFDQVLRRGANEVFRRLQRRRVPQTVIFDDGPYRHLDEAALRDIKHLNNLNANFEMVLGIEQPRSRPKFLIIDPTNVCNFRCRTCFQSVSQSFHHTQLASKTAGRLLPVLPFSDEVKLFGTGEPGLAPDLPSLVHYCNVFHCTSDLLTNGQALKRGLPFDKFSRVGISFDGDNARTFGAIRVGTDFADVVASIKAFRAAAPAVELYLNVTVNRLNLDEISGIARLGAELRVNVIQLSPLHPYLKHLEGIALRRGDEAIYTEQFRRAEAICTAAGIFLRSDVVFSGLPEDGAPLDKAALLAEFERIEVARGPIAWDDGVQQAFQEVSFQWLPDGLADAVGPPPHFEHAPADAPVMPPPDAEDLRHYQARLLVMLKELRADGRRLRLPYCTAPWTRMYVESNGRVRPCCVYPEHVGNLDVQDFEEIWHGPDYVALRQAMQGAAELPDACRTCRSPERYHYLIDLVTGLEEQGVPLGELELPDNFSPPANVASKLSAARAGE